MNNILQLARRGIHALDWVGLWVGLLSLRLILAWEFGEAGFEKLPVIYIAMFLALVFIGPVARVRSWRKRWRYASKWAADRH
jgi:hypothetical protein